METVVIPDVIVGSSKTGKKGLLAGRRFTSGEAVLTFTGRPVVFEDADPNEWMQVGEDAFLSPLDLPGKYVRHSCEPNCAVLFKKGRPVLTAIKIIPSMDELTYDYSQITKAPFVMACSCGKPKCRKMVLDWSGLMPQVKDFYRYLKVVPDYLMNEP